MRTKSIKELIGVVFAVIAGLCMIVFCAMCLLSRKYMIDLFSAIFFGIIIGWLYKKRVKIGLFWKVFLTAMCVISSIKYSWKCIFYSGYGALFGFGVVFSIASFLFFISASDTKKDKNTNTD